MADPGGGHAGPCVWTPGGVWKPRASWPSYGQRVSSSQTEGCRRASLKSLHFCPYQSLSWGSPLLGIWGIGRAQLERSQKGTEIFQPRTAGERLSWAPQPHQPPLWSCHYRAICPEKKHEALLVWLLQIGHCVELTFKDLCPGRVGHQSCSAESENKKVRRWWDWVRKVGKNQMAKKQLMN